MGQKISHEPIYINYNCPMCMQSGKLPNSGGKFIIINDTECKCNGCNSIFPKSKYFTPVIFDATLLLD
jgi:hypothetical protein